MVEPLESFTKHEFKNCCFNNVLIYASKNSKSKLKKKKRKKKKLLLQSHLANLLFLWLWMISCDLIVATAISGTIDPTSWLCLCITISLRILLGCFDFSCNLDSMFLLMNLDFSSNIRLNIFIKIVLGPEISKHDPQELHESLGQLQLLL